MLQTLLEKIDDRFDKAKFASLAKQILIEEECLAFLFEKVAKYPQNSEVVQRVFHILEVYLKFSTSHRENINSSKNSDNLQNSIDEIRLNNESIK